MSGKSYELRYFKTERDDMHTFVVYWPRTPSSRRDWRARDDLCEEMCEWCRDQFGPPLTREEARQDGSIGWFYNDTVFTFDLGNDVWATAFRLRWG